MEEEKTQVQNKSQEQETNWNEDEVETFEQLGLHEDLLKGIFGFGYAKPSLIQAKGIMPFLQGRDCVIQAQSGTGKTGTFAIGLLQIVQPQVKKLQGIVLSPSRELTQQTAYVIRQLGLFKGVKVRELIAGTSLKDDIRLIKSGQVHVVVCTPGKLLQLIDMNVLSKDFVDVLIIDEADEMLGKNFQEQVKSILQFIRGECQIGLYSATMPDDMLKIADQFLIDPAKILVQPSDLVLDGIKQYKYIVQTEEDKIEVLTQVINCATLIYCNSNRKVVELADQLKDSELTIAVFHGGLTWQEREKAMKDFRSGACKVLLSTDATARGIDIQQVGMVINFEPPRKFETYLHRIGRAGRFGKKGVTLNLALEEEQHQLKKIERFYSFTMEYFE